MAKRAFDHCSGEYARYRPPYPDGVFDLIAQVTGGPTSGWAADVGAGTGIFTRRLARRGWCTVAVEPSPSMLGHVAADPGTPARPPIHRVAATGEATGLRTASLALVTCAQSFHWLNPPRAVAEFARIVRPEGALVLAWNNREVQDPFVDGFETLVKKWNANYRHEYRRQDWAAKVADTGGFAPMKVTRFNSWWHLPQEAFVGFTRSVSYIRNVLSWENRRAFEDELQRLLIDHFGHSRAVIPLTTEVWWALRLRTTTDAPSASTA